MKTMLIISDKAAASGQPSQRPLDTPPLRSHDEARVGLRALDHAKLPLSDVTHRFGDMPTLVAAIDKDDLNEREEHAGSFIQDEQGAVSILDIGWMNDNGQQETEGIYQDMILDALDFLAGVIADRVRMDPPFSADRTD